MFEVSQFVVCGRASQSVWHTMYSRFMHLCNRKTARTKPLPQATVQEQFTQQEQGGF